MVLQLGLFFQILCSIHAFFHVFALSSCIQCGLLVVTTDIVPTLRQGRSPESASFGGFQHVGTRFSRRQEWTMKNNIYTWRGTIRIMHVSYGEKSQTTTSSTQARGARKQLLKGGGRPSLSLLSDGCAMRGQAYPAFWSFPVETRRSMICFSMTDTGKLFPRKHTHLVTG